MISILIPVCRKQNLDKVLAAVESACKTEHEVIWLEDTERIGCPKMLKKLTDMAKYDWVCFMADDTYPRENSIDTALNLGIKEDMWLVGMNHQVTQKPGHWIANKKLLDHLENREFFYTGYYHNFCEDELRNRACRLGKYLWCGDAIVDSHHPCYGTALMDEIYEKILDKERYLHDQDIYFKRNAKLSVCMIVKNEEQVLATCLDSVKGADEIIIVDTGSTDKTKEVAAKYTDKIYDWPWNDNFAEARNVAKSYATGDWILSIDADEILEEGGVEKLKWNFSTDRDCIEINLWCNGDSLYVPRVFRNDPRVQWVGRIHETINTINKHKTEIKIEFKRSPAHDSDPHRNMRMLLKASEDNPEDTRTLFYLGREYAYYSKWEDGIKTFKTYLEKAGWLAERADAYYWLAKCYWESGKGEEARQSILMALNINANFKAALLFMADMSWPKNAQQWRRMAATADNSEVLFTHL